MEKLEEDEVASIIRLLELLRTCFKLEKQEIDRLARLKAGQYSRIVGRNQKLDVEILRDILKKIYNLSIKDFLNLNGKLPKKENLPQEIRVLIDGRIAVRKQEKLDLTSYIVIIIEKFYRIGDVISNKHLRLYLPPNLKNKSIELGKTNVSHCFKDVNKESNNKRKIYKLVSPIPIEHVTNARNTVASTWLEDFESKTKDTNKINA